MSEEHYYIDLLFFLKNFNCKEGGGYIFIDKDFPIQSVYTIPKNTCAIVFYWRWGGEGSR